MNDCRTSLEYWYIYVCLFMGCGWCQGKWVGTWAWENKGEVVLYLCIVSLYYLCIWQVQVSVYCARLTPVYLSCSILLHLIHICFLPYICLEQRLQIQTFCGVVVGPGLVSTFPAFMSSCSSHSSCMYGQLAQKR